ncbi:hypothetical protein F4809DRAFT_592457 [Biscogniauxia mediterranea]|nr:hypothetical protein F4809DRAFT_592457 [Biscogniauxia mediterranea]
MPKSCIPSPLLPPLPSPNPVLSYVACLCSFSPLFPLSISHPFFFFSLLHAAATFIDDSHSTCPSLSLVCFPSPAILLCHYFFPLFPWFPMSFSFLVAFPLLFSIAIAMIPSPVSCHVSIPSFCLPFAHPFFFLLLSFCLVSFSLTTVPLPISCRLPFDMYALSVPAL